MSIFCKKCQHIVDNLFNRSRYQPGKDQNGKQVPNILEQQFNILDSYRDIISVSETCHLCAFVKQALLSIIGKDEAGNPKLPDLDTAYTMQLKVTGGNRSRPASKDDGLQLYHITVATSLDIALQGYMTGLLVNFSITAAKGIPQ